MSAPSKLAARPGAVAAVRAGLLLCLLAGPAGLARGQGGQPIPSLAYFTTMAPYYDGDYVASQQLFFTAGTGAVKNAVFGFWVDSICYQTMQGECSYQMGNYTAALVNYEAALRLFLRFNDYFLRIQFPPTIGIMPPSQVPPVPWYVTMRPTVLGQYATQYNSFQGQLNNNQAVFQGGVVAPPVLVPINVREIVRCTCLALRRWRELLGPTCSHHELTRDLVAALGLRPATPNHWSEAWVELELALAHSAAGKTQTARKYLQNAELVAGQFEHPFTCTVLLELGRLDLEAGDFQSAAKNFLEASWSAAIYQDFGVVEEALRYGALTHMLSQGQIIYPPLVGATAWATAGGLRQLNASLLLSAAENQSMLDQPGLAAASLTAARALIGAGDMSRGKIGARMNYLSALSAYQLGDQTDGDVALAAAMAFQTLGSLKMFHLHLIDKQWLTREINERMAVDYFSMLLRDPTPADWTYDPLETLSTLMVPHPHMFEHWFDASLERKSAGEHQHLLEIVERWRRHRFLTTTDMGGRLLNLRWLLEAPRRELDADALLQRQTLLMRYPAYTKRSQRARELHRELAELPLSIDSQDPAQQELAQQQQAKLAELTALSVEQELLLRQMALRREACNLIFPPLRDTKTVMESLPEGNALLAFFATTRYTYAFLMTRDKYGYWDIKQKQPGSFAKRLSQLLWSMGNVEQLKELKLKNLTDTAWKKPAHEIYDFLIKGSKAEPTKSFNELIVVPDGPMWYVPFEALQVTEGGTSKPLLSMLRVRSAPTVGLAVGDKRPRKPSGNTAVVLGRLVPRGAADGEAIDAAYDELAKVVPGAVALRDKPPATGAVYSSLFDRLIVLTEVLPSGDGLYDWSPLQLDRGTPGSVLGSWMSLPWGGPDTVILPAFHTPAERALKGLSPEIAGEDLFLSSCGLMASGTRTALISRWRTGGQSSLDLVREFAQELPHTTASDAWQRSVQLVSSRQIDAENEPRVRLTVQEEPPKADNPFFWAGYLLIDTGASPRNGDQEEDNDAAEDAKAILAAGAEKPPPVGLAPKAKPDANDGAGPAEMEQAPPAVRAEAPAARPGRRRAASREEAQNQPLPDEMDQGNAGFDMPMGDPVASDEEAGATKVPKKRTRVPRAERKKPPAKTKRSRAAA